MSSQGQRSALASAFLQRTGRRADGLWAAPGRVNLIGEHTDYNDGYVLPLAIDRQVTLAAARRDDGILRVWSLQRDAPVLIELDELAPGRVQGWAAYVAGVPWALRAGSRPVGGADIVLSGNVPAGSGLASSAALECAAVLALDELYGLGMAPEDRAQVAQRAEKDFVGVPCGVMDQMASSLGRAGHALLLDTRSLAHEQVPLKLAAAGLAMLIIDTRVTHELVDGRYAERRRSCEHAADRLGVAALRDVDAGRLDDVLAVLDSVAGRRVRHVVTENARVLAVADLLRGGRLADIGPLLTASHVSLRDDFEVSGPELDTAVDAALHGGAVGARMTGAGFGGAAIALVTDDAVGRVTAEVGRGFAERGYGLPEMFPAVPSDGASRIG